MPDTQNTKLGNLGKCSITSNFESSCNLNAKTTKNWLREKLKGEDMLLEEKYNIFEVSKCSKLSYTQNRILANLGKCSITSNSDSSCKLSSKSDEKLNGTKAQRSRYAFRRKIENFQGFRVFNFLLYQNRKFQNLGKNFFASNFDSSWNLRFEKYKRLTERKT